MNLDREQHANRVTHYTPHEAEIKLGDVQCPVPLTKIQYLEKLNNIYINVFGYENDEVIPLYISQAQENNQTVNLLLISDDHKQHYCLIRNMSRLLGNLTKHQHATHYCLRCLHRFSSEELLSKHLPYCTEKSPQRVNLPTKERNILQFENYQYIHPVPYIIYSDFESILQEMQVADNSSSSNTHKIAYHKPCGFSYVIINPEGKCFKPIKVYRGENTVDTFLKCILEEKKDLEKILTQVKPISMSPAEEEAFQNTKTCSLCKKMLNRDRVRDHDHLTGKYRGALHNACNLKFRLNKIIPVVFHNLKNYDGHHIMQGVGKLENYDINVIATSMEKYLSFRLTERGGGDGPKVHLQFIDSLQFLNASLEKLVANLSPDKFSILREHFHPNDLDLLLRKGVYPYEYVNSFSKFQETSLPPPSAFKNNLIDEDISPADYDHAVKVWNHFNLQNLGDYHDFYVKTDVLLLADVFENFRRLCVKNYEIDCAHLLTSPGLSWQACLKMCNQPLELLTDVDKLLFIEKGIRGGISMISKRHSEANNEYLSTYNREKPDKYIIYLDSNNLYGYSMKECLPYGGFEWIPPEQVSKAWIESLTDDGEVGCILEVDLDYPEKKHDEHNMYPLAPERKKISRAMLSPYAERVIEEMGNKYTDVEKLVPNLENKRNYVVHYRNLKLYLSLGLQLVKVHKVLKFKQSKWLGKYIDFNTEQRKEAKTAFEKDFFKLLNNSVYGKTMENLRKRVDIQLVNTVKRAEKLVASPLFKSFSLFTEDLVGIERTKGSVLFNRPIYVGFVILELSKLLMYNFHYNVMLPKYGDRLSLLFTDTDSLCYEVLTKDIYSDMGSMKEHFDFSDYPVNHPLYSVENKKKIGCFKDETHSDAILSFIGLKPKMYSILTEKEEKKTAKGVARSVVKKRMCHQDYVNCLANIKSTREKQVRINSEKHSIFTIAQTKVALSPFDDKRYLLDDGVNSYAYGHHRIAKMLNPHS